MKYILLALLGLGLIVFIGWWEIYKYHDCRKVGHEKLYCILKIG